MKLVRLTDERYVIEFPSSADEASVRDLTERWKEWWERGKGQPHQVAVLIGAEYEDRREPDIESRLRAIESRLRAIEDRLNSLEAGFYPDVAEPPR